MSHSIFILFFLNPFLLFPYLLKLMSELFFLSCSISSRRSYHLRSASTPAGILCNSFSQHYQIDSSSHEFFRTIHLCTVAKEIYSSLQNPAIPSIVNLVVGSILLFPLYILNISYAHNCLSDRKSKITLRRVTNYSIAILSVVFFRASCTYQSEKYIL